jgi:hypothetical protein
VVNDWRVDGLRKGAYCRILTCRHPKDIRKVLDCSSRSEPKSPATVLQRRLGVVRYIVKQGRKTHHSIVYIRSTGRQRDEERRIITNLEHPFWPEWEQWPVFEGDLSIQQ